MTTLYFLPRNPQIYNSLNKHPQSNNTNAITIPQNAYIDTQRVVSPNADASQATKAITAISTAINKVRFLGAFSLIISKF